MEVLVCYNFIETFYRKGTLRKGYEQKKRDYKQ